MTQKDYITIAAALLTVRNSYAPHWDANLFRACNDHAKQLAHLLAQDNPHFDRARFLKACGATQESSHA